MKVVRRILAGTSGAERLLLAVALFGVLATGVVAAIALLKRPGDISNPDAAFKAGKLENDPTKQAHGKDESVDWPRFGYDRRGPSSSTCRRCDRRSASSGSTTRTS